MNAADDEFSDEFKDLCKRFKNNTCLICSYVVHKRR